MTQNELALAVSSAVSQTPPVLHVCRERDVGLFSLIQQVVANVPWALGEGRVPVADFRERTCYWTPIGHRGGTSVWEYYFEPLVTGYPSAVIPEHVTAAIAGAFPDQGQVGHFVGEHAFVSNHFGDHPSLKGKAPLIPFVTGNPSRSLREWTSRIIRGFVRPRGYIERKVDAFFSARMGGHDVIGVHVRGTDAVSASETRKYRQGSLDLGRFVDELRRLLDERSEAKVFVATDAEASLEFLVDAFGDRVLAYDAVRHAHGEPAGQGPTGCIMPAYITADRDRAAQNGEDAIVEYLLLGRCRHLVHNGASLATTVLLKEPLMSHTNTHRGG
jgi:hypothetical protein